MPSFFNSKSPSNRTSINYLCISISFVRASTHMESVGIYWYEVTSPSINVTFKFWITILRHFLFTCFVESINSNVPSESLYRCIGILLLYSLNNRVSICFVANSASSTYLLKTKVSASLDELYTLPIGFVFHYIGLTLVKFWFTNKRITPPTAYFKSYRNQSSFYLQPKSSHLHHLNNTLISSTFITLLFFDPFVAQKILLCLMSLLEGKLPWYLQMPTQNHYLLLLLSIVWDSPLPLLLNQTEAYLSSETILLQVSF